MFRVYAEIDAPFDGIFHAAENKLLEIKKQLEIAGNGSTEQIGME